MANIGLTEQEFTTFCYGTIFLIEQFYKDPANMAAFEKWNAEQKAKRKEQERHEHGQA